ncbi:MAG: hypothetical protein LBD52_00395 [Prevotellaceae bacterium]|jgi:uncharacterized membrane protein|nr:hypothetical protein [Prevotellaceae bacterium]
MKYKYISISLIVISLLMLLLFSLDSENAGSVGMFLTWAYILLGVAVVAAVGIPLVHTIQSPAKLKKVGIYAGVALVVLIISILFSSPDPVVGINLPAEPSSSTLLWTDTGIIATYILLIVAFGSIIAGGIINMRNR